MKKLSEMNTDEMLNTLAIITPEIGQIVKDSELMDIFKIEKPSDIGNVEFGISRIVSLIPQICTKHKNPVYNILAALTGKNAHEIAGQNGLQTIREIKEALQDKDLVNFFSSQKP